LLFVSGFFSASEVALFGLERKKVPVLFADNQVIQRYLLNLLSGPRRLLISILIGNNIVNVAASIISVTLVTKIAEDFNLELNFLVLIQIITISTLVLIFGELIPKMIATRFQIPLLKIVTLPIYYFTIIIYPISEIVSELIKLTTSKFEIDKKKFAVSYDEIAELSQLSNEKIKLNKSELAIIESISDFKDTYVVEIMTPRVDIVALPLDDDIQSAIDLITKSGHSRIPVYENSIDNIVGVLYAKDLLKFIINPKLKTEFDLKSLIKRPLFVPETKKIKDLLSEFQAKKNHIAIVVDEYGGTAGLITLEDIIEEVVGDIWDEYDKIDSGIQKISERVYIVNAELKLIDLEIESDTKIDIDEEIKGESIAALILNQYGQIPEEGISIDIANIKITTIEVAKKRIRRVRIEFINA
jgi:CBS domain containing-hemolysin-like protein